MKLDWCIVWGHRFIGKVWDESDPWPFEPHRGYIPYYLEYKKFCTRCGAPKDDAHADTTWLSRTVKLIRAKLEDLNSNSITSAVKSGLRMWIVLQICEDTYLAIHSSSVIAAGAAVVAVAVVSFWAMEDRQ